MLEAKPPDAISEGGIAQVASRSRLGKSPEIGPAALGGQRRFPPPSQEAGWLGALKIDQCKVSFTADSAMPVQSCNQRQGLQLPYTQNNQPYPPDIEEPVQCAPATEVVSASFSGLGGQVEETDSGCRVKVHGTHYPPLLRQALRQKHQEAQQACRPHNLPVLQAAQQRELEAVEHRIREEQRAMDQKIVLELDRKVADQQSTLEKAGVAGFYVTTNPQELTLQMNLLELIRKLQQRGCQVQPAKLVEDTARPKPCEAQRNKGTSVWPACGLCDSSVVSAMTKAQQQPSPCSSVAYRGTTRYLPPPPFVTEAPPTGTPSGAPSWSCRLSHTTFPPG
ncbi:hypothetical protein PANDA_009409 [Ailuropoda melanoleuca]|uniref:Uncharacterized protein n=1 Tax=Ailuropoda melanoleuca TaxID=9646 RepID=D2HEZ5_AILME|nr:hypothetical protein PANDA_009409 [Ailuropoda melanoleuca]